MIRSGHVTAFYLFDVADAIDLANVTKQLGGGVHAANLSSKPALPSYVRYQVPPLQFDGGAIDHAELRGYRVRLKVFDYGVVSFALTRPVTGRLEDLSELAQSLTSDTALESEVELVCRSIVDRILPACDQPRPTFLSEDYIVFAITAAESALTAEQLLAGAGRSIAQLLRAETSPLSAQEQEEVVRHRLSYLETDLVVPTWNTALVYDTESGVQGALEIFEYANSQLLQYRYYDGLLEERLARFYKEIETTRHYRWWWPHRYTHPARELHALFIDVNELTDRTDNALKLVGDVYAARLLALANSRLGVNAWRASVQEKLRTLDEIYRFAVDQTGMERGELLEIAIVAILVFELILFFLGIMK
jgi:hypothetical protein